MTKEEKRMIAEKAADFIEHEGTMALVARKRQLSAVDEREARFEDSNVMMHFNYAAGALSLLKACNLITENQRYALVNELIQEVFKDEAE